MTDLTFSIVSYNSSKIIERTITSIIDFMNDELSYKIYLIDNNSTDDTVEVVKKFGDKIELITLSENIGFGAGHNTILDKINSKYHVIVNPDIVIETSIIEDMFNYMENNKDIGMLSPSVRYLDGRAQYLCKIDPNITDLLIRVFTPNLFKKRQSRYMMLNKNYAEPFEIPYATGCFMFIRSEIFKTVKGFDERFFLHFEDADITRRINNISKTVFFPYGYVIHDWKRESRKKPKLVLYMIFSGLKYFSKWGFKLF